MSANVKQPGVKWPMYTMFAVVGILFGLSVFTFGYAEGLSYFSNDPQACTNCHVMREELDAWSRSSHKAVAGCNDCHTPHTFPEKWLIKGLNGFKHSWAFTSGNFPEPIRIGALNAKIAQDNCIACHEALTANVHRPDSAETLRCVACHGNVGHATRD